MSAVTERSFFLCARVETRLYQEVKTFCSIYTRRKKKKERERLASLYLKETADRIFYSVERAGNYSAMSFFLRTGFSLMFSLFAALLPIG